MIKKLPFLTLLFILGLAVNLSFAYGGVIEFNSGERIEGLITKKAADHIEMQVGGENLIVDLKDIKAIRGKKPRSGRQDEDETKTAELTFGGALRLASQGSFLYAEDIFNTLLKKNSSDTNVIEALNAIDDVRSGAIKESFARRIFEGAYYSVNGDYPKSIAAFNKALEIEPESIEVYYSLASAHQALGEYEKAIPYFEKLIDYDSEDADVLFNLGAAHYFLADYDTAISYLKELEELIPGIPESYSLIGVSYCHLGDQEKGRGYIDKAREIFLQKNDLFAVQELESLLKELAQVSL